MLESKLDPSLEIIHVHDLEMFNKSASITQEQAIEFVERTLDVSFVKTRYLGSLVLHIYN
jgi:hypothetical protein